MAEDEKTEDSLPVCEEAIEQLAMTIAGVVLKARSLVERTVNTAMLTTYWEIGRYIVEFE